MQPSFAGGYCVKSPLMGAICPVAIPKMRNSFHKKEGRAREFSTKISGYPQFIPGYPHPLWMKQLAVLTAPGFNGDFHALDQLVQGLDPVMQSAAVQPKRLEHGLPLFVGRL